MSSNKKRYPSEQANREDVWELNNRLEEENEQLKQEISALKIKLAKFEDNSEGEDEDDDDDDDNTSVCDGTTWSKKYFLLKQYRQEHGDCKVPRKHPQLGQWTNDQRKSYKKGSLSQDRIDKLNKIGFWWGKDYPDPPSWDDRFSELKDYNRTFGNCNIHVDPDPSLQTELAKWVAEQRKQGKRLRKQKPSSLTLDQYRLLNDLGFQWKIRKARIS